MGEEEREDKAKVILSPTALEQLNELSSRYLERILNWLDLLALFPLSGAQVPQDDLSGFRRIVVSPFVVIYEYDAPKRAVYVLWIQHGKRLLPSASKLRRSRRA